MGSSKITINSLDDSIVELLIEQCILKNDDTGEYVRIGIDNNGIYIVPYVLPTSEVSE